METQDRQTTEKSRRRAGSTHQRRIVLVDDHPVVRQGLAQLLNSRETLTVVGEADSAPLAMDLIRKQKPDLVILDMSMPKTDGLELVKQIKAEMPNIAILVISMHDETVYAERALRAGARGYVMKKEPSDTIFRAIDTVLRGEMFASDRVKQDMLELSLSGKRTAPDGATRLDQLSDRELQVFQLLGNGMSTRAIAEQLHLSVKTVESYRENLKVKLNVKTGPDLLYRAIQWSKMQPA